MMTCFSYGPTGTNLIGTVAIQILDELTSTPILGRTTSGITQIATTGVYKYQVNVPEAAVPLALWDEGGAILGAGGPDPTVQQASDTILLPATDIGAYTGLILLGPEGSPNGTLPASPPTIVITPSGSIYIKTVGNDTEGWIQAS